MKSLAPVCGKYRLFLVVRYRAAHYEQGHVVKWVRNIHRIEDQTRGDDLMRQKEILQRYLTTFLHYGFVGPDVIQARADKTGMERTLGWTLEEVPYKNGTYFAELYPDPKYRHGF